MDAVESKRILAEADKNEVLRPDTAETERQAKVLDHYLGTAGELHVASQLSLRGYGVNLPLTDVGDDLFATNDVTDEAWRVQVKSSANPVGGKPHLKSWKDFYGFKFSAKRTILTASPKNFIFAYNIFFDTKHLTFLFSASELNSLLEKEKKEEKGGKEDVNETDEDERETQDRNKNVYILIPRAESTPIRLGGANGADITKYCDRWDELFPDLFSKTKAERRKTWESLRESALKSK